MIDPLSGMAAGPAMVAGNVLGGLAEQAFSARQAKSQMRFQERMSSTAWQRGVADMRAAGLNPMLAFSEGPASAPQGAMSQGVDVVSPAVSSALSAARLQNENKLAETLSQQQVASAKQSQAQAALALAQARNVAANTPKAETQAELWSEGHGILKDVISGVKDTLSGAVDRFHSNMSKLSKGASSAKQFLRSLSTGGGSK